MILADKILHTSSFRLELSKWTPDYRSHLITWNCEVETLITGIPPHACHPCILGPLLQPYGDIQTYCFNKKKGTCKVITYTSTPTAIPKSGTISFPKRTIQETQLQTFPVSMMTIPSKPAMARTAAKARQWDDGYQYGDLLMETAYEGNVDPDVLYDANVDINQGYSTRGKEYSPSDDLSDREPADWKGKNI
ncbi:unnamed protein product [Urochloa decumbens]|uniref:Uncharacterized protein n=1 Tax=Urochloa decumbens TaxID=240449 RepID=A0ABC9BHV3_9POAL